MYSHSLQEVCVHGRLCLVCKQWREVPRLDLNRGVVHQRGEAGWRRPALWSNRTMGFVILNENSPFVVLSMQSSSATAEYLRTSLQTQ